MKNVGIVGSRDYPDLDRVRKYIASLPPDTVVVSGHGGKVDLTAEQEARRRGLEVIIYPADWNTYGKVAGLMRNTQIVEAADVIVAFWDGASRGTLDTITKAVKSDKKVVIYGISNREGISQ